ncbi:hypothetical protein D3C80_1654850 [compost metagenome]
MSPTLSASSTINKSGDECTAIENASLANIPDEYVFTGLSIKSIISENSIISHAFAAISPLLIPIREPFSDIFSLPVYSGLNPAPNSNNAAIFFGLDTVPVEAFNVPQII